MQVSDILRVKGNTLFTAHPDQSLMDAVSFMADKDLGSLVKKSSTTAVRSVRPRCPMRCRRPP